MSSAAAREARKQAILNRGKDRLAKLTTSARGDDSPVYQHADPPLASLPNTTNVRAFLGEDTPSFGTPPTMSRKPSGSQPSSFASTPDPSIWSEEQQQQLMNALMGGLGTGTPSSIPGQRAAQASANNNPAMPDDNPLAALMAMMPQPGGENSAGMPSGMVPPNLFGPPPAPAPPVKKSLLQKIMPLIHLLAGWIMLSYFVLWREPQVFEVQTHGLSSSDSIWRRWAELGWQKPQDNWGVQFVPFFWAFTTLAIVLHSWRIFKGLDPIRPPMLLSLALPHLPSPLPSIILNGMKYLQIGSIFVDDIAVLLFGIGVLIWVASWFAN